MPRSIQALLPTFLTASIVLLLCSFFFKGQSESVEFGLLLFIVFLMGMPHGALDVIMIEKLSHKAVNDNADFSMWQVYLGISVSYLFLAVLFFSLWFFIPVLCLPFFFVIAAIHFRHDWDFVKSNWLRLCNATLTISLPSLFHSEALLAYFSHLLVGEFSAYWFVKVLQATAIMAYGYSLYWAIKVDRNLSLLIWLAALLLVAYCLSPIWYFCAYFCAVHSILHTSHVKHMNRLDNYGVAKAMLLPMLGTLLLLISFYVGMNNTPPKEQILQLVFIGLFALTVPHMLLTVIYDAICSKAKLFSSK